jgi:CubicO group peptidase (beta-lactamase class C family)
LVNPNPHILAKNKEEILKRIQYIENNLPGVSFGTGQPLPNWDETAPLEDMMAVLNVPGVSIAVINNFKIEWLKHYGVKDLRTNEEITADTLFEAGSASKTFTAIAALNAVKKELLNLDESVNNKLKTWKIPDNDFTKEKQVTLRQLLAHTAGINRPDSMFGHEDGKTPTIIQILNGEPPAKNDPVEVVFVPGSEHQYSNLGYIIIEKLLQDIYDKNLSEIMKKMVFDPLEMMNSVFDFPTEEIKKRTIVPHDDKGEAKESGFVIGALGHGGLISTPYDIAKFVVELMHAYKDKSDKIISSSVAKQMFSPELPLDPTKFFGMTGQGLGTFLIEKDEDFFFLHPGTNMPGAVTMMIGSPTTGHGLVIMSNGIQAELLHIQIMFAVAKLYNWLLWNQED